MQVPSTTVEFLDALKARRGWTSDYRLAKELGWRQTTVSNYRVGRSAMASEHAMRVAEELGLSHAYVVACMQAERENNGDVAKVWKAIADHFRSAAAIILIALAALSGAQDAHAAPRFSSVSTQPNTAQSLYITLNALRSLLRWLAQGLRTTYPALVPA